MIGTRGPSAAEAGAARAKPEQTITAPSAALRVNLLIVITPSPPGRHRGVVVVLTPNLTTFMLRRELLSSFRSSVEPSAILRSANDKVPSCCDSANVSA